MSRKIFFTPGPSELYFTVEGHLKNALRAHVPSISHRGGAFKDIYRYTQENLRGILQLPEHYKIFFTSSATEVWEHLIRNCVSKESIHLVNGSFSKRFWEFSGKLGKKNAVVNAADGSCSKPQEVRLTGNEELLAITLNETSTGVAYPLEYLRELRSTYPEVLIALDGVSSLPVTALDFNLVDTAYLSVQKCFGLPAGLGLWIVGPRCFEKAEQLRSRGELRTSYRDLITMASKDEAFQTIETPNVLNIYLLGKVVEDMLTKGMDMIRREAKYKAAVLSQAIESLNWLEHFVATPDYRSETTVVARCHIDNERVVSDLQKNGLVIGKGYGSYKNEHIRIANFPAHSKEQVENVGRLAT